MTVEQLPTTPNKQGSCQPAAAGVASGMSNAIMMLRCKITPECTPECPLRIGLFSDNYNSLS